MKTNVISNYFDPSRIKLLTCFAFALVAIVGGLKPLEAQAAERPKFVNFVNWKWLSPPVIGRSDGTVVQATGYETTNGVPTLTGITDFGTFVSNNRYLSTDKRTLKQYTTGSTIGATTIVNTFPETVEIVPFEGGSNWMVQDQSSNDEALIAMRGIASGKLYMPPFATCANYPSWLGCNTATYWAVKQADASFYPGHDVSGVVSDYKHDGSDYRHFFGFIRNNGEVWMLYDVGPLTQSYRPNLSEVSPTNANQENAPKIWVSAQASMPFAKMGSFTQVEWFASPNSTTTATYDQYTANTLVLNSADASSMDNYYKGSKVLFKNGTSPVGWRHVLSYDGATKTITLDGTIGPYLGSFKNLGFEAPIIGTPKVLNNGFYQVLKDNDEPLLVKQIRTSLSMWSTPSLRPVYIMVSTDGSLESSVSSCDLWGFPGEGMPDCTPATLSNPLYKKNYYKLSAAGFDNAALVSTFYDGINSTNIIVRKNNGDFVFFGRDSDGYASLNPALATGTYGTSKVMTDLDHTKIKHYRYFPYMAANINKTHVAIMEDGSVMVGGKGTSAKSLGGSGSGYTMTKGFLLLPGAISNVVATNGSAALGQVNLSWTFDSEAMSYNIYRGTTPANLTLLKNVPVTDFTLQTLSTTDTPGNGVMYYYAVAGVNPVGTGPISANDSGWANHAPASSNLNLIWDIGSASVSGPATTVDQNPMDAFSYTVLSQPQNGTVEYQPGTGFFKFTPAIGLTDGMLNGPNSFTYTATDLNGASVQGTGVITQRCGLPELRTVNGGLTIPYKYGSSVTTYSAGKCAQSVKLNIDVLNPTTLEVIDSKTYDITSLGSNLSVNKEMPFLPEGVYPIRVKMTAKLLNGLLDGADQPLTNNWEFSKDGAYTVSSVNKPSMYSSRWSADQDEDTISVEMRGGSSNCPLTTEEVASVDYSKCFGAWSSMPPGLSVSSSSNLILTGIPSSQGQFPVRYVLSKYDPTGVKHQVGEIENTLIVSLPVPPVFTHKATHLGSVRQAVDQYTFTVKQVEGSQCKVYLTETEAATNALAGERSCSVSFIAPPEDLTQNIAGVSSATLAGRFTQQGNVTLNYKVQRWFKNGANMVLAEDTIPLTVGDHGVKIDLTTNKAAVGNVSMALIDKFTTEIKSSAPTGGPGCPLVHNEAEALDSAQVTSTRLKCWARYTLVPQGINLDPRNSFKLGGVFPEVGTFDVSYKVSALLPATETRPAREVVFADTTIPVEVTPTLPPNISWLNSKKINVTDPTEGEKTYFGFAQGGYIAKLKVVNAVMKEITIDVIDPSTNQILATYTKMKQGSSRFIFPPLMPTWSTKTLKVVARYTEIPQIYTETFVDVLALLPTKIAINANMPRMILNTDGPVRVETSMGVRKYAVSEEGVVTHYLDSSTLGNWKMQLGMITKTGWSPMSDEVDVVDGKAIFNVESTPPLLQLMARARAICPLPGIDPNITLSTKPIKAVVTNGLPIDSSISGRAKYVAAGSEPYSMVWLTAQIDKSVKSSLDSVSWFSSDNLGTTWQALNYDDGARGFLLAQTIYANKTFKIRTTNKYTGYTKDSDPFIVSVLPLGLTGESLGNEEPLPANTLPITIKAYATNTFLRVPVTVMMLSDTYTGTPVYHWSVNGSTVANQTTKKLFHTIDQPGRYIFNVESQHPTDGTAYVGEYPIDVVANRPPTCNLRETKRTSISIAVTASCLDPDGKITGVVWRVNGVKVPHSFPTVYVAVPQDKVTFPTSDIVLSVTDDSGAETITNFTVIF